MAIEFNDNIHVKVNRPTDFRFGPFTSIAQANSLIPIAQRYHGLLFGVYTDPGNIATSDITFYYYWDGLTDTDVKPLSGSKWSDIGADIYRNSRVLVGATTFSDSTAKLEVSGRVSQVGLSTNTFFGFESGLNASISDIKNVGFGYRALKSLTTGIANNAFGYRALTNTTTGILNDAFGGDTMVSNTTGSFNNAFGTNALQSNTTGNNNSAFGYIALASNTSGLWNSAFGYFAGGSNTTGRENVYLGFQSGQFNNSNYNTVVGARTFENATSSANNTIVGYFGAQAFTNVQNSVFIGYNTRPQAESQTNQNVFGYNAIGLGSNTSVVGNSSTVFGRWWGNLLLGTSVNSGDRLRVEGTARITASSGGFAPVLYIENTAGAGFENKNVALFVGSRGTTSIEDNTNIGLWQKSTLLNNFATFDYFNGAGMKSAYIGARFLNHTNFQSAELHLGVYASGVPNSALIIRSNGDINLASVTSATGDIVTIDANNVLRRQTVAQIGAAIGGGSVGAGIGLSKPASNILLGDNVTLFYTDTPTVKDFFLYQVGTNNLASLYSGFGATNPTLSEAGFAATNSAGSRGAEIKAEYDSASPNPFAKIQINSGTGLFNVFSSDQTTGYRVRDDIHQRGLVEHADYSANKTDLSYTTIAWMKSRTNYNASVAQYFTHDASGVFAWVNI